ncbi:uncharacterized protein LOC107363352 [Tetranychus urticae]|uniref:uncharacterized protein LOC107363352 n=1 Tax=Tetranychus urticae TaxID=32264 RepID=UPI00077B9FFF|nr:uncharacterized protein LOC107363352 [Tetranychus urticae]
MTQDFAKDLTGGQVFISFLKLTKLDPYLFLQVFAIVMQGVTITQLAEDKMCINQLHFPKEYCLTLTSNHSENAETTSTSILVHANSLKNWQTAIDTIPSSIVALFLSYWLEKYPHYLKAIMLLPNLGAILSILILLSNAFLFKVSSWAILLASVPSGFSGSITLLTSSFYTYVSWSTPTRFLVMRFAMLELFISTGSLCGTYLSGKVLTMKPWIHGQPENYLGVLFVSLALLVTAFIWGFFVTLEGVPDTAEHLACRSHREVVKDVFQLSRFKELAEPLTVKRSGRDKTKLIMAIISGLIIWSIIGGDYTISFQFSQKVYGWSAEKYSTLSTYFNILPALLSVIVPQLLKCMSVRDSAVGLIGALSVISMSGIKGIVTNDVGFALANSFGGLGSLASIANRALVSQIVDPEETAKIFAIISSANSYASIAAAYIYTHVYSATMDFHPGLIYNIAALLALIPAINFLVNDIAAVIRKREERKQKQVDVNNNTISLAVIS